MAAVTGEVVPTPGEDSPYKIVFKQDGQNIGEIPVASIPAGEALIKDILGKLRQIAEDEGYA